MQVFELPAPNNPEASRLDRTEVKPGALGFSPDSRFLAAWDYGRVLVIDTMTRNVRTLCSKMDVSMSNVPGIGFTADSRGVISQHETHSNPFLRIRDVESGEMTHELTLRYGDAVEIGPGGRFVYLGSREFQKSVAVFRWNPLTDDWLPEFGRHNGYLQQLAVSADEQWVAASTSDLVRVWNIVGGKLPSRALRQFKVDKYAHIYCLALSSDGTFLAARDWKTRVWNVQTGQEWEVAPRQGTDGSDFCREITFHPSRPILAFSGKTDQVGFWDAAAHTEVNRFAWGIGRVQAVAFSPDGLRCAAAGKGKVVVWDVDV